MTSSVENILRYKLSKMLYFVVMKTRAPSFHILKCIPPHDRRCSTIEPNQSILSSRNEFLDC